jgi:riboflavin kinase / FMN adenylyltransferase
MTKQDSSKKFRRKVKAGNKIGRKIGCPTLNFNVGNFSEFFSPGVYACEMKIDRKPYRGSLYYGPKINHPQNILEVHVEGFSRQIYGHLIEFKVCKKLRDPMKFDSLEELKKQINKDIKALQK